MRLSVPIFLLVLTQSVSQSIQQPSSCGPLLLNLAHNCGQPDRAPFESCCASIAQFNNANCFCQPASFQPAAQLSGDQYGFSARMTTCNITTPYARPVPSRDFAGGLDTCPYPPGISPATPDALGELGDDKQQCPNPTELRRLREHVMDAFDGLQLPGRSQKDIEAFRGVVRGLFHKNAQLTSIGLTEIHGREHVEDFLLARMVGIFQWRASKKKDVIWSSPGLVSYAAELGDNRVRYTFISFAPCSGNIVDLFIVEHRVMSALGSQYYYPEFTKDSLTEYDVTPSQFCGHIAGTCGELRPYGSEEECIKFLQNLKSEKRVLCNKFDNDRVSMTALLGDTVACRYHYALMTTTNPTKYCPLVGMEGKAFCEETMCPQKYYGDMFGDSGQQRYESSDGFSCSTQTGICTEQWSDDETGSAMA